MGQPTHILALTSLPLSRCLQMSSFFFAMAFSFLPLWMFMRDIAWRKSDELIDVKLKSILRFNFVKLPEFLSHFSDNILFFNYNIYGD
jgi:hypothetical protein